jgi:hypothetical protein
MEKTRRRLGTGRPAGGRREIQREARAREKKKPPADSRCTHAREIGGPRRLWAALERSKKRSEKAEKWSSWVGLLGGGELSPPLAQSHVLGKLPLR